MLCLSLALTIMERDMQTACFVAIKDAYPKLIIARTRHETYDYQGIQVIDLCRWLRKE